MSSIKPRGEHGLVSMAIKGHGEYCTYCKREMVAYTATHPTKDHVLPRSRGGRKTVWACFKCNNMKADMLPNEWERFMRRNPGWWQTPGLGAKINRERRAAITLDQIEGRPSRKIPTKVPVAYPDDPMKQAGFERIYENRLYLLRESE